MPMLVIGVLLLLAKLFGLGPVANWSWWWVALPFGAAVVWWQFADSSGLTQRRAMDKMEQRKAERRAKSMAALGLDPRLPGASSRPSSPRRDTPAADRPESSARDRRP